MFIVQRNNKNPLLHPDTNIPWQAHAVFNWSPIEVGSKIIALYRAESSPDMMNDDRITSVIGKVHSYDGETFTGNEQYIVPDTDFDRYGCEDPRTTFFEGKYYTTYTALSEYPFRPEGIRAAIAISKDLNQVEEKHLVTPFNAKALVLFPRRVNGKVTALITVHTDIKPAKIALFQCDSIEELWDQEKWNVFLEHIEEHTLTLSRNDSDHVEIGAVPIYTKHGWLLIYSHIQKYATPEPVFGVEALLLDLEDPKKIISRTKYPFMIPEEIYEQLGHVPNIIWPSGALLHNSVLTIYYGASDTICAQASLHITDLLDSLQPTKELVTRISDKPVLKPRKTGKWEAKAVFNPGAVEIKNSVHILYRAMSEDNTSSIGYARSSDAETIEERLNKPIYIPREQFESKKHDPKGNSGCEDPRITLIDKTLYMLYTAYDQEMPRIAVSSISLGNFLNRTWDWSKPALITPEDVDDKDGCLLPERFERGYLIIHRVKEHVCADYLKSLDFEKEKVDQCITLFGPRKGMWDSKKVGIASPPLKTKDGWLMLYHGVSDDGIYRVGAILTHLEDPTTVLSRTALPIFEPELPWEKEGQVGQVVFPCGAVIRRNTLYIYYGGGDSVVGIAKAKLSSILTMLHREL